MAERDYRARIIEREDTVSLLDIVSVVVRRRRFIVLFTFIVTALCVGYLFLTMRLPFTSPFNLFPTVYKPTARVLFGEGSKSSPFASVGGSDGIGSLADLLSLSGAASGGTSADLAQALLKTDTLRDRISSEFDLSGRYKIVRNQKTGGRRVVSKSLVTRYDIKSKILEIGFKDSDPVFAARVVNRVVELLEEKYNSLTMDKVLKKKSYIETSLQRVRGEADQATAKMLAFQKQYKITDLNTQAAQQVQMIATYRAQLIAKQLELQSVRDYMKDSDPQVIRINNEIAKLEKLISDFQKGSPDLAEGNIIPQEDIPELSVLYLNLKRDTEIQQTLLNLLMQQYETTKLEEMDTSGSFQIVEKADVPEVKDGPARALYSAVAGIVALFVAVLIAFSREYVERARQDPREAEKLAVIRAALPFKRTPPRA